MVSMTAKFGGESFDGFSTILITSPIPLSIFPIQKHRCLTTTDFQLHIGRVHFF